MTTIAGGHFMPTAPPPRSGILLNASPASSAPNSPKRSSYLSPSSPSGGAVAAYQTPVSSHSSTSSTASSSDDIVSSTSATSAAGTHASSSSATAHHPLRKIRFAPDPVVPRYDYDDEDEPPLHVVDTDSAAASPNLAAQTLLSPSLSPSTLPPAPSHSPNLNGSHGQASCSTLGLSLDGAELPDAGQITETNTVTGSECGTDDTHTVANSKKKVARWSRLLPYGRTPSLTSEARTLDEHQSRLCRSPSRESTASGYSFRSGGIGRMFGLVSDNGSSSSLGNLSLSRRKTVTGADSAPVSPTISLRSGHSLKPVVSEAGTAATVVPRGKTRSQRSSAPPTVRRGTRLLNGRVYGRRQQSGGVPKDFFANIRDEEPEFVEWGHGGMGSVRTAGLGSSRWARLQSDKRVSVGHDDGTVASDEDDGSGMNWVKRRREAREREMKEREERERRETAEEKNTGDGGVEAQAENAVSEGTAGKAEDSAKMESEANANEVPMPLTPTDASKLKELRETRTSGEKQQVDENSESKEGEEDRKKKEHVYTAVTIPAPRTRSSSHSRQNSLNTSGLPSPTRSTVHIPTQRTPTTESPPLQHMIFATSPLGAPIASMAVLGPSPLSLGVKATVTEVTSSPSSSASSAYEEESPLADKDEDNDDIDEEEEEAANEQARKTAIGAGVEKVSRHKE